MVTIDGAVAALRELGIPAFRRVWALGDTIGVPIGRPSSTPIDGATAYPEIIWIAFAASGLWELVGYFGDTRTYHDLETAVRAAVEIVAS